MQDTKPTLLARMSAVILFTACICAHSLRVACTPALDGKPDSLSVRSAVEMSLSWQKFWYGDFFGSECLGNPAAHSNLVYRLDSINTGIGYISGTNFMINIEPYVNRVVAEISMGNMLGPCNEGELYPRITNLKRDSKSIRVPFDRIVKSYPPIGDLPSEAQLAMIRYDLKRRPLIQKLSSSEMPVDFTLGSSLDPYIIVCSRECQEIWIVEFEIEGSSVVLLGQMYPGLPYLGDRRSIRPRMVENVAKRIRSNVPGVQHLLP